MAANTSCYHQAAFPMTIHPISTHFPRLNFYLFDEVFHRAKTAYELNRAFWRQGMMTEAMSAIITSAFTELGLHRIEAVTDDINERSKGLLRKLGFTHEGTLRLRFYFRGRFWDEHYFGLLKDEWH